MTAVAVAISYEPVEPLEVSSYCGRPIYLLGFIRTEATDGWVTMTPHHGTPGTVGAEPPPVEDPDYAALIAQRSEELRSSRPPARTG